MKIGFMIWISQRMTPYQQMEWMLREGFEAVGFQTGPAIAPEGGFDPEKLSAKERQHLKERLSRFADVEIHAPFGVNFISPDSHVRQTSLATVQLSLDLASLVGARVVTVHQGMGNTGVERTEERDYFREGVEILNSRAEAVGVQAGWELTRDYDIVVDLPSANTGVTLDVGHVRFEQGAGYCQWGSMGGLIRYLGSKLLQTHIHDYDERRDPPDHLPLGCGDTDFEEIIESLRAVDFRGSLCIELDPQRWGFDAILETRNRLAAIVGE